MRAFLVRLPLRLVASAILLYGAFASGGYFIIFSVLSMPIGAKNVPGMSASLLVAFVYFWLSLAAVVQCWRRPPYPVLTSVLLAASIFGYLGLRVWVKPRPNPSIERTVVDKPPTAAHVERWGASRQGAV